jgi:hypothetical protein
MVYFNNKNSQFGYILEGLGMENVGIYYDHLEYFTAILYHLWPFLKSLWSFGYFFLVLECLYEQNLATLVGKNTTGFSQVSKPVDLLKNAPKRFIMQDSSSAENM